MHLLPYLLRSAVDFLPLAAVHHKGVHGGSQPLTLLSRLLEAVLSEEGEEQRLCAAVARPHVAQGEDLEKRASLKIFFYIFGAEQHLMKTAVFYVGEICPLP